jgi:inosine-uridine nucleoside N-ribohydrolase
MIQVGFSSNLARLLASSPDAASPLNGMDLVALKVKLLSVMAGDFRETTFDGRVIPKGTQEFNLRADVRSAQHLFKSWPTPIVASGYEVGLTLQYPPDSIDRDYRYVRRHPIAETYRMFCEEQKKRRQIACPHAHALFDLTSVLYAARPGGDYFSLSNPGTITVLDDARTQFDESANGAHRYLILDDKQKARTMEAMVMLVSQPPSRNSAPSSQKGSLVQR